MGVAFASAAFAVLLSMLVLTVGGELVPGALLGRPWHVNLPDPTLGEVRGEGDFIFWPNNVQDPSLLPMLGGGGGAGGADGA